MPTPSIPNNGDELELGSTAGEAVYAAFCIVCEYNHNYSAEEDIPESCPKCGEHKEFSIMSIDSLRGIVD
ncbi:hypothetical protein OCF84_21020 (plasmid) [Shewanella xiamenensis]|uniref:FBX41/ZN365 C2H2-type zinc finger domain-containing protein n=1 Tax=Shewanella xiamenensis TaxID=332186 RepID=A0ABT6UDU0_9GAMM|nr:hypothetical protein [Shewanella xiamenensis]MDI5832640.1 hypothetical protein [Shewanella xiamenensis]WHF58002.1 hypothetical protein OCF84_21020 [Shewanella xiamenensis]